MYLSISRRIYLSISVTSHSAHIPVYFNDTWYIHLSVSFVRVWSRGVLCVRDAGFAESLGVGVIVGCVVYAAGTGVAESP